MEPSKLTERLRGILKPGPAVASSSVTSGSSGITAEPTDRAGALEQALGGEWRGDGKTSCFVVEHRIPGDAVHGRACVRDFGERLHAAAGHASLLTRGAPGGLPFVFFDLETTGLSGGAGTYAFLVGCGTFDADGAFVTKQYVMARYGDERAMLETLARDLQGAGLYISFNGKSFDAPVLETRYMFHRLEWWGARLGHLDALHPARQFWGQMPGPRGAYGLRADLPSSPACSLIALETQVLGARRVGDVAGFEIPARYFQFVRSGDARPLAAVLAHNRLDLLSLAGLTSRLLRLVDAGPAEAHDAREALALGKVYARSGLDARARQAFARAAEMTEADPRRGPPGALRVAALHALAMCERRARRYVEAAARWRAMLDIPECPAHLAREATEALAIHHEHRVRDLRVARAFALRSLENGSGPAWHDAVGRRIMRIDRKIARNGELLLD